MDQLFNPKFGYSVIPVPSSIVNSFNIPVFLGDQREFQSSNPDQLFVLGGFQALGNPSSFHHPERRQFLVELYAYLEPLLSQALLAHSTEYSYISTIPDRFAIRRSDQEMGSETWHKDQSLTLDQSRDSFLLGGWINLDRDQDQYFSCIPGEYPLFHQVHDFYQTQLNDRGGFKPLEVHQPDQRKVRVTIPPYHIILFHELLTHEVIKGPKKRSYQPERNSYRLYLKWFISNRPSPYWPESRFENFIQDQTQIGMSYYQPDCPMYASAHSSTAIPLLQSFSEQFIPQVKHFQFKDQVKYPGYYLDRFIGQGNSTKPSPTLRRQGLRDWDLQFSDYSKLELAIYQPKKIN